MKTLSRLPLVLCLLSAGLLLAQETPAEKTPPTPLTDAQKFRVMKREWKKKAIENEVATMREKARIQLDEAVTRLQQEYNTVVQEQTAELKGLVPDGYELDVNLDMKPATPKPTRPEPPKPPTTPGPKPASEPTSEPKSDSDAKK